MRIKIAVLLNFVSVLSLAGPTVVGNGDDGNDLEKTTKITSGVISTTQKQALELVQKMNVKAIRGLGQLPAELKNAEMYLVDSNIQPDSKNENGMDISPDQKYVYARTFAQPNAAVRFFPASVMLSEEQLVKLHIHEALHRSLPEIIRENESAVSEITMAIASPNSTFDLIEGAVNKHLNVNASLLTPSGGGSSMGTSTYVLNTKPTERLNRPSILQYSYTTFELKESDKVLMPVSAIHRIDSFLHPFGGPTSAFGFGLSFSYINLENQSYMGPLQISARLRLSTWREFDIEMFGDSSMYSLANEELKSVENARDITTLGLSMKRDADRFYTENYISYSLENSKDFKIGNVSYAKAFAPVATARISFGGKLGKLHAGAKTDFILTESAVVTSKSGSYTSEKERVRLVKFGPEIGYRDGSFDFNIYAQSIVDGTTGYNLSDIGNLMGEGAGQSYVGASLGMLF